MRDDVSYRCPAVTIRRRDEVLRRDPECERDIAAHSDWRSEKMRENALEGMAEWEERDGLAYLHALAVRGDGTAGDGWVFHADPRPSAGEVIWQQLEALQRDSV